MPVPFALFVTGRCAGAPNVPCVGAPVASDFESRADVMISASWLLPNKKVEEKRDFLLAPADTVDALGADGFQDVVFRGHDTLDVGWPAYPPSLSVRFRASTGTMMRPPTRFEGISLRFTAS